MKARHPRPTVGSMAQLNLARRRLRRQLKRQHTLALRLSVSLKDPAGNRRTVAKRVSPRLKGRRSGRPRLR